jgi:hypothetical protein
MGGCVLHLLVLGTLWTLFYAGCGQHLPRIHEAAEKAQKARDAADKARFEREIQTAEAASR